MKNTGEKILETSLQLFNSEGLSKVTLRTIAKKMEISQGNLNYHFKKREDIIEALYFKLVSEIDERMHQMDLSTTALQLMYDLASTSMHTFYKYRFFLLDFAHIMRENKTLKNHYANLVLERQHQFERMFNSMIGAGILREAILPNEYENLYKRIQIIGDFWMSSAEIEKKRITKKAITEYLELMVQSIFPYLTRKGQEQYHLLNT